VVAVSSVPSFIAQSVLTSGSDAANSMEAIDTSGLIEGAGCYVIENKGNYLLLPDDVQSPSPPDIVAATGGGNWILQSTAVVTP